MCVRLVESVICRVGTSVCVFGCRRQSCVGMSWKGISLSPSLASNSLVVIMTLVFSIHTKGVCIHTSGTSR